MPKCPHCNTVFTENKKYYDDIIQALISVRNSKTREQLNRVINITLKQRGLDTNHSKKMAADMLLKLKPFSDEEISYGLNIYFENFYHEQGYGWEYAVAIIHKQTIHLKEKTDYEKRVLDRIPPIAYMSIN